MFCFCVNRRVQHIPLNVGVLLGAYPCLEIRLVLRRDSGYYMMTIVSPTIVIAALSWSSFFVPVNLPTAKLSIALVTALSSLAMDVLSRAVLAPELKGVSYVTTIDIWTNSCLLFVLSALIIQLIVISRAPNQQKVKVQNATML